MRTRVLAERSAWVLRPLAALGLRMARWKAMLGGAEHRLRRRADRFEPAADVDLGMRFAAEMSSRGAVGGRLLPAQDSELFVSALDHKPVHGIVADDAANLTLKLAKR